MVYKSHDVGPTQRLDASGGDIFGNWNVQHMSGYETGDLAGCVRAVSIAKTCPQADEERSPWQP